MISINDIIIVFKGLLAVFIAWFTDTIIVKTVSLTFISPFIRDFFIETKDIINWFVSSIILITVVVKLINERRKRK